ncbi:hypothetical protein JL720_5716 [Aureococcus anophagefferens]|nr:hypothetical protein JL720_5716 [Aureococcus anophagefferens]
MAEELLLEPDFLSQTLRSAHETAAEAEACADEARAAALHERAAQGYVAAARRAARRRWRDAPRPGDRAARVRAPRRSTSPPASARPGPRTRSASRAARPDDDAGGAAGGETPASEAAALARAVERLAAANAALVAERDDLRRDNAESRAIKAEMVAFKALFQQKFDALRDRLEAFRRDYPSPANPANATRPGDPDPPKSAASANSKRRPSLTKESAAL